MHVDDSHVKTLMNIIINHGQLGKFDLHLIHQHGSIENGIARLESDLQIVSGKWSKATSIDSLNLRNVHGVMFKFCSKPNQLILFEFSDGQSSVSANDVNENFVKAFTNYLNKNNLSDRLALQIGQPNECIAEIEVESLAGSFGIVVLPKAMVHADSFLSTGWLENTLSEPPKGQSWAKKVDESHQIFINKKIEIKEKLVEELINRGVINVEKSNEPSSAEL